MVLGRLKRKPKGNVTVAVCPMPDGISIARVQRDPDLPPSLDLCEYKEVHDLGEQDAVLKKLVASYDLNQYRCTSLMDPGSYSLLLVEAPDVLPSELRAAIRWRIRDLIDFHHDDAVIDLFEVPEEAEKGPGFAGKAKMMYAVAARSALVKQRIDQLVNAGLDLSVVDVPELAMRNIASLLPEDVGGAALVYLGRENGLVTLTRQSILYLSRRIESGSESVLYAPQSDTLDPAIQQWLDGIVVELRRSLDYYESHFTQPPISNLVIAPLERQIPGMAEYLSEQLDVSARMLDLNALIDSANHLGATSQFRCFLAIGAALRMDEATL